MNAHTKQVGLRIAVIAVFLVAMLAVGIGVTGAAARAAIPGDALHPVKKGLEETRLTMAEDGGVRAQLKMAFAAQRLEEIDALIREGRYLEVDQAVLAFEASINGALIELESLASTDPVRAAALAKEITAALTQYAQTLSALTASVPDNVRSEVNRALDSTHLAGSLNLVQDDDSNDNTTEDLNDDDGISNHNGDDDDNSNDNGSADDSNTNDDDDDDSTNVNTNGDDESDGSGNSNDDNSNADNTNDDNSNGDSSDDDNSNDDNGSDDSGSDDNGNDDNGDDDSD